MKLYNKKIGDIKEISKLTDEKNFLSEINLVRKELYMTKKLELYRCEICGNLVEVVLEGAGELVCCGEAMTRLEANTTEADGEKHLPVFISSNDEIEVRVGSKPHPMIKEHYIQFIECVSKDEVYVKRKYLHPDEEPMLRLKCYDVGKMSAKEYCNVHGLWESEHD